MEFLGIFLSRKRHGKKKKHSRSFVSAWFSVSGKRDSNPEYNVLILRNLNVIHGVLTPQVIPVLDSTIFFL